jgi:hypothetical protein
MVAPTGAPSQNSSSRYPAIWVSEAFDARTPNDRLVRNLNMEFNDVWLQTIMEPIQCIALEGSPHVALSQQGAKVIGQVIVAECSIGHHRGEPSIGN